MPLWIEAEADPLQHITLSNSNHVGHKLVMLQHLPSQRKRQAVIQLCLRVQL